MMRFPVRLSSILGNLSSRTLLFCITSATLLLLTACDNQPPDNYFPLKQGKQWHYHVTTHLLGQDKKHKTLTIENLGTQTFNNDNYLTRLTSHGTHYYFKQQENGIYRHAKKTLVETHPTLDKTPRLVLPLPMPKHAGKSWSVPSQSYTFHRVLPHYEPPFRSVYRFNMTYSVVAVDETVTVPAGKFEHCLLIEGQAQVNMFAGSRRGFEDIEITTREWYAPGVGLVKLERSEPLDSEVFKGGSVLMELTETIPKRPNN